MHAERAHVRNKGAHLQEQRLSQPPVAKTAGFCRASCSPLPCTLVSGCPTHHSPAMSLSQALNHIDILLVTCLPSQRSSSNLLPSGGTNLIAGRQHVIVVDVNAVRRSWIHSLDLMRCASRCSCGSTATGCGRHLQLESQSTRAAAGRQQEEHTDSPTASFSARQKPQTLFLAAVCHTRILASKQQRNLRAICLLFHNVHLRSLRFAYRERYYHTCASLTKDENGATMFRPKCTERGVILPMRQPHSG